MCKESDSGARDGGGGSGMGGRVWLTRDSGRAIEPLRCTASVRQIHAEYAFSIRVGRVRVISTPPSDA